MRINYALSNFVKCQHGVPVLTAWAGGSIPQGVGSSGGHTSDEKNNCTVLADIKWTLDSGGIGRRTMTGRFDADNKWWNGVSGYKYDYCAGCKSQPIQYGAAKCGSNNAFRYRRQFKMVECSD